MKTRNYDWYDTKNEKPMYGVQVYKDGGWLHVIDENGPCIYESEAERDQKRMELRQKRAH